MLGVDFQYCREEIPELHSERLIASQVKKRDTGEILGRNFYIYKFEGDIEVKREQGEPPYFVGVLPDKPETFTNPIEISYYYKVRQPYTIDNYEGYLMYGQPIVNKKEYELKEGEIDPDELNLFRGWFKRRSYHMAYDYYIPIRTGAQFAWDEAIINVSMLKPRPTLTRVGGTDPDAQFLESVTDKLEELREQGYTNARVSASTPTGKTITATKRTFNTGGVTVEDWSAVDNTVSFKFQGLETTGLAFELEIFNCSMWLSIDGIERSKLVYQATYNNNVSAPTVKFEVDRDYPYMILRPLVALVPDTERIWPGFKLDIKQNEKVKVILNYLGEFYRNYKDDFIDMDDKPEIVTTYFNRDPNRPNLSYLANPRPPEIFRNFNFDEDQTGWRKQMKDAEDDDF